MEIERNGPSHLRDRLRSRWAEADKANKARPISKREKDALKLCYEALGTSISLERHRREEDRRCVAQSIRESHEHLSQVIVQWSNLMSTERFLAEAEQHAQRLPEADRVIVIERLELARRLLGGQDPLDFLRDWKTPEERCQPRYSDELIPATTVDS